jgi:hypothetical protein
MDNKKIPVINPKIQTENSKIKTENSNENQEKISTNKIMCFNGKFTLLTIFILILLLIYINKSK